MLYSNHRLPPANLEFEAALRETLGESTELNAEFLAGLPTDALLQRLSELDSDTLVVTPGYFEDGVGHLFSPREAARPIAAAATAPVSTTAVVVVCEPGFAHLGSLSCG
ncbi:hypothetical protein [Thiocapsa bogorovii]|uniref:hypothetical protein n=1 Tax=Thiocapsa bogorovii TaxID=521689 RepID=UPI001E3E449E|nr:hypothetical protein [Thiocapsa bogorovii]UHD17583.1 hypothetical protein LT988_05915 [Thiocapsa bogorovii]